MVTAANATTSTKQASIVAKTSKPATAKTKSSGQTAAAADQLSQDIQALGLSNKNTPSSTPAETPRSGSPLSKIPVSKRINVLEEHAKRTSDKPKLNLVIIGRFDLQTITCAPFNVDL